MKNVNELMNTFAKGLEDGVQHYRVSDGLMLMSVVEIIMTLQEEGELTIIMPHHHISCQGNFYLN